MAGNTMGAMRDALRRFGQHRIGCAMMVDRGPCDCGLSAAYALADKVCDAPADGKAQAEALAWYGRLLAWWRY